MRDAWLDALTMPAADPTVATVDIRGNGPVFCSGGGSRRVRIVREPGQRAHLVRTATSIGRAIDRVRDRTTVHLHGHCAGSGLELAAFAGRVAAAPDTLLSLPELALGLVPGAGGTVGPDPARRTSSCRGARTLRCGHRCGPRARVGTRRHDHTVAVVPPIRPAADETASTAPATFAVQALGQCMLTRRAGPPAAAGYQANCTVLSLVVPLDRNHRRCAPHARLEQRSHARYARRPGMCL